MPQALRFLSHILGLNALVVILGLTVGLAVGFPPLWAQDRAAPQRAEGASENPQQQLDAWKIEIDQIAAGVGRPGLSDRSLVDLRTRAETIRARADKIVEQLTPNVQALEARLKQLGPAPQVKEGEPPPVEADAVKQERETQQKALAELQGFVKQANLIQLKADEVARATTDRRRERFTSALLEQSRSVLDPSLLLEAASAVPSVVGGFVLLIREWIGLLAARASQTALVVLGLVGLGAIFLLRPVRRRLVQITERDARVIDPPQLTVSGVAAAIVAVNVILPVAFIWVVIAALRAFDLNPDRINQMLFGVMGGIGSAMAVYSLALAVLAPAKPQWRLIDFPEPTVQRLRGLLVTLAVTVGIGAFAGRMTDVLSAPIALVIAVSGLFALLSIILIMLVLRVVASSIAEDEAPEASPTTDPNTQRSGSILWRWLVPLAWIAALVGAAAAVMGYVALARFLATQMVWAGAVFASLRILMSLYEEAIGSAFRKDTAIGTSLNRSMGISREAVEQIGVVLAGFGRLIMFALAALLIVSPWGIESTDLVADARAAFFGFRIGGITISLSSILAGLVVFVGVVAITRGIQNWLEHRFLPHTRMDVGLKNSIRTAFGYVGFVVAAMLAFASIGLNLENVAIVAGALSVGIGFGLQSIVNNFVSGLILLAERPIKSGDLIEIGAEKGFVRKINVRSTEIETFDRGSLIVPNSTLISGSVKNWMHRDLTGRCVIDIGVDYSADPDKVREVLLGCARGHKLVMIFPAPNAFFTNFGESAMQFRLVCTVANVNDAYGVESDLRFSIIRRMREERIDIPLAQRDLHIRQLDDFRGLAERYLGKRSVSDRGEGATADSEVRDGQSLPGRSAS